jgi:signal transduction histidine kinase
MRLPTISLDRWGAAPVIALLVATLGLTATLAYYAHDAARSHEAVAERVLHDYVDFAGWEFVRLAEKELNTSTAAVLSGIRCVNSTKDALPPESVLTAAIARERGCQLPALTARSYFRAQPSTGQISIAGAPLDTAVAALANVQASDGKSGRSPLTLQFLADTPATVVAYARQPSDDSRPLIVGFVADVKQFAPLFERIVRREPLLPAALLKGAENQRYLSARVTGPAGQSVYESPQFATSQYVNAGALPAPFGQFHYQLALRPDTAQTLVIGGLPQSRVPLLLILLLLDAGLLAVAIVQVRRERQLAALRADFVTSVSHERRTPLAQIRMFAETLMLGRTRTADETRRSLGIIHRESQRLTHLVDNVMSFRRGERGVETLVRAPVALVPLAREVLETFSPLDQQRPASLRLDASVEVTILADPSAIRQILLNLLDNAVKHGPLEQTVTLSIALAADCVQLIVDDEGPGIDPQDTERIWQPFVRLSRSTQATTGAGIGLSVVRQLVALHEGRAWVTRAPSGGARFVAELPGATAEQPLTLVHSA